MFTLADITRKAGAKRRSAQLWAEAGALKAEPATERMGAGVHRLFDEREVVIACVLRALSDQSISIGVLVRAAQWLRNNLRLAQIFDVFRYALAGDGTNLLLVIGGDRGTIFSTKLPGVANLDDTITELLKENGTEDTLIIIDLNKCLRNAGVQLTWARS